MATIDLSILYQDYVKKCTSSNIIPLCMVEWYNESYGQTTNHYKRYNTVNEIIDEINQKRLNHLTQ